MTNYLSSILTKITPVVSYGLTTCKNRISDLWQKTAPFRGGTLAKNHAPEIALGVGAQFIGTTVGSYFPIGAIGARVGIAVGQVAYQTFRSTPASETKIDYQGWVAGMTAATLTTMFFVYNMDLISAASTTSPQAVQYLIGLLGTTAGGFVGLYMVGKDPSNPQSAWYDNYINRNMRYMAAQQSVQFIGSAIPSITTVANFAVKALPASVGGLLMLPAVAADKALSLIFQSVAAYSAYYALPLSKSIINFLTNPPPTLSSYENLDPNLLIKIVINTLHGNPVAFAHELMSNLHLGKSLKGYIANLADKGVSNDQIVNLIVRSINEYATLLEKGHIQEATQELLAAISADEKRQPKLDVEAELQKLLADGTTTLYQKLNDLKTYQDRLKTDTDFKQKLADIVTDNGDRKGKLEKLSRAVSCTDVILDLYKKMNGSQQLTECIEQLISQLNVLYHKEKLNRYLYTEILKTDTLPKNLGLHPHAQEAIGTVLSQIEDQEKLLLGAPLTHKSHQQALIEAHIQGYLVLFLKKSEAQLRNPPSSRLTKNELQQFYSNLNKLVWAPLPYRIPQAIKTIVDWTAIPLALKYGDSIHRVIQDSLVENTDTITVEEISDEEFEDDELFFDALEDWPVDTVQPDLLEEDFVIPPLGIVSPVGIVSPAKLTKLAIGNPVILAEQIIKMPLFQGIINRVVADTVESDILVNALVRSVNLFASIFQDRFVRDVMEELASARPELKGAKMKLANHAIYKKFFENKRFTMSLLEGWVTYGTKSLISRRLSPVIKTIIEKLKENKVDTLLSSILDKAYDEKTMEVCLRAFIILTVLMVKKGAVNGKNIPLREDELGQFYSNLVNLTFAPFSHPITDTLKSIAQTGLPLALNENVLTPPLIQSVLDTVSNINIDDDFVLIPDDEKALSTDQLEKVKDKNKPFNLIRKIQKLWYKFTATVKFLIDQLKISTKKSEKASAVVTPSYTLYQRSQRLLLYTRAL